MDLVFIGAMVAFLLLCLGMAQGCSKLGERQ